jgi:hypothetical protein
VVTNLRAMALGPLATAVEGPFQISKDGCQGMTLPSKGSCTIDVIYVAPAAGPHAGKIAMTAPGARVEGTMGGITHPMSDPTVDPVELDFGRVAVGQTSKPLEASFTTSTGAGPGRFTTAITNVAAGDFALLGPPCPSPLPAGATCRLSVIFKPSATGVRSASLNIIGDLCGGGGVVQLVGTGQ